MNLDFETVVQDKGSLKALLVEAGAKFVSDKAFKCPAHQDRNASAGIFCDEGGHWRYKCQACGWMGDIFDLRKYLGKDCTDGATSKGRAGKKSFTGEELKRYLTSLGDIGDVYKYRNVKRELVFYVARVETAADKTFRPFVKQGDRYTLGLPSGLRVPYNLPQALKAHTVIVVEGEKCADVLGKYGFVSTTSAGGAKNARHTDWAALAGKNVILWPDADADGRRYAGEVERILSGMEPRPTISVINPSDLELAGKEDAFDYVQQCISAGLDPQQELQTVVSRARVQGPASELLKQADLVEKGRYTSVGLPWQVTSLLAKALIPQTVSVLCGSPGASKSLMILQALRYWQQQGVKAVCLELEWDRQYHLRRALAQEVDNADVTDIDWIKDNLSEYRGIINKHTRFLNSFANCLNDSPDSQMTLAQVHSWVQKKAKAGYRVICVDPITLAAQSAKPWIEDNLFIQNVRNVARDYNCSVLLVSHPVKAVSLPDLAQLSGGAAYSRFTDTILWLESHDAKSNKVRMACGTTEQEYNRTLHLLKARNGKGHGARLAFGFEVRNLTLSELGIIVKA